MNIKDITSGLETPTKKQLESVTAILMGSKPMGNLIECSTSPDIPLVVRNWIWSLLFIGTQSSKLFYHFKNWEESTPSGMAEQIKLVLEAADHNSGEQPRYPGQISIIPADSREHVWKLLGDSMESSWWTGTWADHLRIGTIRQMLNYSPGSPQFDRIVLIIRSGKYDIFGGFHKTWELMTDSKVQSWARKHFIARFLEIDENVLPEAFSAHSGLQDKSKQTATTQFIESIFRESKSPELSVCIQELFCWLVRTKQNNFLAGLIHWTRWSPDVLELLFNESREDFQSTVEYILFNPYKCNKDTAENHHLKEENPPDDLDENTLLSLRGMVSLLPSEKLLQRIDELLEAKILARRAFRDSMRESKLRNVEESEQMTQSTRFSYDAMMSLVTPVESESQLPPT